jgi:hypothetical protein
MASDAYAFKESQERKMIHPDEYHPAGLRAMPGIIPLAFMIVTTMMLYYLAINWGSNDRGLRATFALTFGTFGAFAGSIWWQKTKIDRQRSRATDAVMRDYPWDPHQWVVRGSHRLKITLIWATLVTCFLLMFNVWSYHDGLAFYSIGNLVILVFNMLPLWLWCNVGYHWLQARKFGMSRVEYLRFPYSVREPVRLRWIVPRNVTEVREARFALRCLHAPTEHHLKNGGLFEEWWAGEWRLMNPGRWAAGECVELQWEPTQGLPGTRLMGGEICFWRLDVFVSLPGADFFAGYLVPVYGDAE